MNKDIVCETVGAVEKNTVGLGEGVLFLIGSGKSYLQKTSEGGEGMSCRNIWE